MITHCNVFNMWPKTTLLLPGWRRDAKRLDTPGSEGELARISMITSLVATAESILPPMPKRVAEFVSPADPVVLHEILETPPLTPRASTLFERAESQVLLLSKQVCLTLRSQGVVLAFD